MSKKFFLTALVLCMGAVSLCPVGFLGRSSVLAYALEFNEVVQVAAPNATATETATATAAATVTEVNAEVVTDADTQIEVAEDGSAAKLPGARVAIEQFARMNKGTAKPVGSENLGYRYQMAGGAAFAVLVIDAHQAVVYINEDAVRAFDFDANRASDRDSFIQMVTALDAVVPNGGRPISAMELDYRFTANPEFVQEPYHYRFALAGDDGNYYLGIHMSPAAIQADSPNTTNTAALFCLTGYLTDPTALQITEAPKGFDAFIAFLTGIDTRPFWVSLRTAGAAMIFIFIFGILAARFSLRMNPRLQGVLDSLFTIPLVLPPTVCGFLLLVLLGNSTPVGRWLVAHGVELVFSWPAAVIAAAVVGFPLMYRTVRGAFESQDANLFDAARTLGWSEQRIFFRLMLPLAWPSIAAGTVLAFARAMGEFGATLFVAGNYPGVTQTMPIAIYFQWMGGHSDVALFWVVITILLSFLVILFINWYSVHLQSYKKISKRSRRSKGKADTDSRQQVGDGEVVLEGVVQMAGEKIAKGEATFDNKC